MASFELDISGNASKKLSVSELTREIKYLLETSIQSVWVEGEISNFKHHSSGHIYFSLKDSSAQLSCVMWRSRNQSMFFSPRDGMKILARGRITVYEKRGAYQLDVQQIKPAGVGELQMAFEQLKARLVQEGLFETQYKQEIPTFPQRIGIATSPTGAAIQDMITILQRRFPPVEIIIRPTKVQGEGAARDIASAIEEFNDFGEIDLLIIGRGGGSIEDLWAFNEEQVARAIFASQIPVISAVGHEVDFCISDFVADLRAPTPSAAAELAVPDANELKQRIKLLSEHVSQRVLERVISCRDHLKRLTSSYGFRRPIDLLKQYHQRLDELFRSMKKSIDHAITLRKEQVNALEKNLNALNPTAILGRGYSICFHKTTKEIIKDASTLKLNDEIEIKFFRGQAEGKIKKIYD